jgi:Fe-S cluster biogenesis protein NfuA
MDVYTKIQKVLADISPVLEADGGGVEIIDFQDGSLTLNLLGACSGCPMSSITFGVVVENKLREACGDKIKNIYYNKDGLDHNYHLSK